MNWWAGGIAEAAVGYPLSAGRCHPERSEESRCVEAVGYILINTGRREDVRLSDGRHQKAVFPTARGENVMLKCKEGRGWSPLRGGKVSAFGAIL